MTDTSAAQYQLTQTTRVSQEIAPSPTLRYPIPISPVRLQTTNTTVHTAEENIDFHIESLIAVNVTNSTRHVTVHVVQSGDGVTVGNAVVFEKQIPANDFVSLFTRNESLLVPPEAQLVASCEANDSITLHGFGYDYLGVFSG